MRILVCSDLHLNISRYFSDAVMALDSIYEVIVENTVDQVWILGDVYTNRRPHSKEKEVFERWVQSLLDEGMEVLILKGNHDEYPNNGGHSYSEFVELNIPGVRVVDNPHVEGRIFLGHMLLKEAKLGPNNFQDDSRTSIHEIFDKYPDCLLYLFGDVHKHQTVGNNALYIGSSYRVDFGERNEEKGVVLVDTTPEISWKFIPIYSRKMIQYDTDLTKNNLPTITTKEIEGARVKLVYTGTSQQLSKIKEDIVRGTFQKHCYELTIVYNVVNTDIVRNSKVNESIKPEEALQECLAEFDLSDIERDEIFRLGCEIITNNRS